MTKIEELYWKIPRINRLELTYKDIHEICQQYAEFYAKKCLEIAANEAMSYCPSNPTLESIVFHNTIVDIKLPEHD